MRKRSLTNEISKSRKTIGIRNLNKPGEISKTNKIIKISKSSDVSKLSKTNEINVGLVSRAR